MNIERIQVEGGFLDGLDLKFKSGLNVLIGARGTGKTSIIELIRYALNVKNATKESSAKSLDQARAVLSGGEVSVSLIDPSESIIVSRTAEDENPRPNPGSYKPLIYSQTDLESIGLSDAGRLSLIDDFIYDSGSITAQIANTATSIKSFYKEIETLQREVTSLSESVEKFDEINARIKRLEEEQNRLAGGTDQILQKQYALGKITTELTSIDVKSDFISRLSETVSAWTKKLEADLYEDFGLDAWDEYAAHDDPLAKFRPLYLQSIEHLEQSLKTFHRIKSEAEDSIEKLVRDRSVLEQRARALRSELESQASGAGSIAREITLLKSHAAQAHARHKIIAERQDKLDELRARRDQKIENLLHLRYYRTTLREDVIRWINATLSPWIELELEQSAQVSDYTRTIATALRASGLKHNELAAIISEKVSPQELMDFVETSNYEALSKIIGIPLQRSARILEVLFENGITDIVTCNIEDNVKFSLLDGSERKSITELSAGQRCTIVLSIIMQHQNKTLIIDQPEDHLDNAFIANTVIKSLQSRKGAGQVILATHNANIPILGGAELVIELASDGRNGRVKTCLPLESPEAIRAISDLMEGGKDAFDTRASLYKAYKR